MADRMQGIYAVTCVPTGEQYVGQSVNIPSRWKQHIADLRRGYHCSVRWQKAWDEHGPISFTWTVLELVDDTANLIDRERHFITTMQPQFNTWGGVVHLDDDVQSAEETEPEPTPARVTVQEPQPKEEPAAPLSFDAEHYTELVTTYKGMRIVEHFVRPGTETPEDIERQVRALRLLVGESA
jgi:GIY-YIG catalytic domain